MKYKTILVFSIAILAYSKAYSQESTFKKYVEIKTNDTIAYAGGLPIFYKTAASNLMLLNESRTKVYESSNTDLKPTFKKGKYYFFLEENPFKNEDIEKYVKLETPKGNYLLGFLTFQTSNGDVIQIKGATKAEINSKFERIKFFFNKEQFIKIVKSEKLKVSITSEELNDFESFDYVFDYEEIQGFRDFAYGLGWLKN